MSLFKINKVVLKSFRLKIILVIFLLGVCSQTINAQNVRSRVLINEGWKFFKYKTMSEIDSLIYDIRPEVQDANDNKSADARPTEAVKVLSNNEVLKSWILPTGNDFIKDPNKRYKRPNGNPGKNFPFVQNNYNDQEWEDINLPHDWAINGPFYEGWNTEVGGGMGRLPSQGVAWYRRKIEVSKEDKGKSVFLEIEGAMSYAMIWVNGYLVGGWPYGYASWQVNLTPYLKPGKDNQIAIRLDNPLNSSRWYPGGGIYRNIWLTKTNPVHIGQWGTTVKTTDVSSKTAKINLEINVENEGALPSTIDAITEIYLLDSKGNKTEKAISVIKHKPIIISAGKNDSITGLINISNPKLWGPPPTQKPNLYIASTKLLINNQIVDEYQTQFGIRDIKFDPDKGVLVNGEHIYFKGVNQHHDLGALGAAFNARAAERQLEILRDMGCNAIRMSHNPPAPELLELTDKMGFLVIDEIFDSWKLKKTPLDFHLIFPDWHEQDLRALIRRDKNHPSVIMWSLGNEVGEQYTGEEGAKVAKVLNVIAKEEDNTRPTTVSINYAKPNMPMPAVFDIISLNYQGEGIRYGAGYEGLKGITTPPLFPAFRQKFPNKMIVSSENAATLSSRGEYSFPVVKSNSAPAKDGSGGNPNTKQVSAYELYTVEFGASPDKVFATLAQHPYVAGGFVWSGWDYIGEPSPYYLSRSSYFGIIDLAGFKKDRYYLYQAQWKPGMPMAHILPHWTWPDRLGQVTPVHVFTSGDEAELFLNGRSLGRKKKNDLEYRLRWDDVIYEPGILEVVSYKNSKKWAEDKVVTAGNPTKLLANVDRKNIHADGKDLAFITVKVSDKNGNLVPNAYQSISFEIEGPGEIVATDNGDPTSFIPFSSNTRPAFNGLCLVIVKGKPSETGLIKVKIKAANIEESAVVINTIK